MNDSHATAVHAPRAPKRPFEHVTHGHRRSDPWSWLRDKSDPETAKYLTAENAYADQVMEPLSALVDEVELDLRSHIPALQVGVANPKGPFEWWDVRREGWEYRQLWRRPLGTPSVAPMEDPDATLVWDENELAQGTEYFDLYGNISPDGRFAAQAVDVTGDERYDVRVIELATGIDMGVHLSNVAQSVVWAPDSTGFLYHPLDEVRRPCAVKLHVLHAKDSDDDQTLFADEDRGHWVWAESLASGRFAVIGSGSMADSELYVVDFSDIDSGALPVLERQDNVRAALEFHGQYLLAITNSGNAINKRVLQLPISALRPGTFPVHSAWSELIPHRDDVVIDDLASFDSYIVLLERVDGQTALRIINANETFSDVGDLGNSRVWVPSEMVAWSMSFGANFAYDASAVRVQVANPATPTTTMDIDLSTGTRSVVHAHEVGGDFDPSRYVVERIWATAADGVKVPVSIVRRADLDMSGPAPMMLVGYGSYGATYDAGFSAYKLALLDRGVACATAHIRGGGEFGEKWWLDGKLDRKANTFTDFIACAKELISSGRTSPDQLAIRGGSAGGMLMGAACNQHPELFRVVVTQVPFVDCVTTVLDASLPLSEMEWDEWGDPRTESVYHYMLTYSPYDNVSAQDYPAMYVTGGFNDPRVSYWEPAKYVARLRDMRTNDASLIMRINMGAGHFGASGRYGHLHEEAMIYAFVLRELTAAQSHP